jgi:hypothetical protein
MRPYGDLAALARPEAGALRFGSAESVTPAVTLAAKADVSRVFA